MAKNKKIEVLNTEISVQIYQQKDYISLTNIALYKDSERTDYIIMNWMRNRNTIEFLGIWEQLNNPDFNSIEFDGIRKQAEKNDEHTPEATIRKFRIVQMDGIHA